MTADVIAYMLLSCVGQCFQKLVELILGLATEHRQQFLGLRGCGRFGIHRLPLRLFENIGGQQVMKQAAFHVQLLDQIQIITLYNSRVLVGRFPTLCTGIQTFTNGM